MLAIRGWHTLIVMMIAFGVLLAMVSGVTVEIGHIYASEEEPAWKTFTVEARGKSYPIQYWITGGRILDMIPDVETSSFTITIGSTTDGKLYIRLPRELIDSRAGADGRTGEDTDFAVFVDEVNVNPAEMEATSMTRTLTIDFDQGAETIEIVTTLAGMSIPSQNEWKTEYVAGRFLNSDPPKPDGIFMFQYRVMNGTVENFEIVREDKGGDVLAQGVDIKIDSSSKNALLEIKIPRNFPYTNNPPEISSGIDDFVFLANRGNIDDNRNTTDCFFVFSVPFTGSIEMTLGMSVVPTKSPYHGDDIHSSCVPETVVENVPVKADGTISPSRQVKAGVAPEDVFCPSGLHLILNPVGKPYCATEQIIEFLNKVWHT